MFSLTTKQIADTLKSPLANVVEHWPHLQAGLHNRGIKYDSGYVAALATIGVECRVFKPIDEYGSPAYFWKMYDIKGERPHVAKELGNVQPGDGVKFHGRGWIQLTGRDNYAKMSPITGINLLQFPEKAKEEPAASIIFAEYLMSHGCDVWAQKAVTTLVSSCGFCDSKTRPQATDVVCHECCWKMVRKKVNGGLNHYKEFREHVGNLLKLLN